MWSIRYVNHGVIWKSLNSVSLPVWFLSCVRILLNFVIADLLIAEHPILWLTRHDELKVKFSLHVPAG